MRLTEFRKLRNAITNLDWNYMANAAGELKELLSGRGREHKPEDTVITEEGIFYMHARSGIATKVAMHIPNQYLALEAIPWREIDENGYHESEIIEKFHTYHLVRCNEVSQHERDKWKEGYRISQRSDGAFFYHLTTTIGTKVKEDVYQTIENQKLTICKNCLIKINSLLGEKAEFTKENFSAEIFFDSGFQNTWRSRGAYSQERGQLADIYPKDWKAISRRRMDQAGYICEECNTDLSASGRRGFLHLYHRDHLVGNVSYVRLQCLCIACRAEKEDGAEFRRTREYQVYQKLRAEDRLEMKGEDGVNSLESEDAGSETNASNEADSRELSSEPEG